MNPNNNDEDERRRRANQNLPNPPPNDGGSILNLFVAGAAAAVSLYYANQYFSSSDSELTKQIRNTSAKLEERANSLLPAKQLLTNQIAGQLQTKTNYNIHIIGSSVNGLGMDKSDLDICAMPTSSLISTEYEILRSFQEKLANSGLYHSFELRPANVPLLRFCTRKSPQIKVDMTIGNHGGIRSTHLIRNYTRLDERVRKLVVAVKLWAQKHEINDASQGGLSGYSLALMLIHYLQFACKPAVLPCLHNIRPDLFHNWATIEHDIHREPKIVFSSSNTQPVDELLIGFFEYFDQFNFGRMAIDVGRGEATTHNESGIVIIEPFSGLNTSATTRTPQNYAKITAAIRDGCSKLKATKDLHSICRNVLI